MNINSTKESKDNLSSDPLNINSSFKNFINLILTLGFMAGLSFCSLYFCNWYGCNSLSSFFRADLLCNACVDASYHLKNYQISLYGSIFTLITYKLTSLINRAKCPSNQFIFEDYSFNKNL